MVWLCQILDRIRAQKPTACCEKVSPHQAPLDGGDNGPNWTPVIATIGASWHAQRRQL